MTEQKPALDLTDDEIRLVMAQRRIDTLRRLDVWIADKAALPKEVIAAMARNSGDARGGDDSLWTLAEGLMEVFQAVLADAERTDQPVHFDVYEADEPPYEAPEREHAAEPEPVSEVPHWDHLDDFLRDDDIEEKENR